MYLKIDNGVPVKKTRRDIQTEWPDVSFPKEPTDLILSELGYVKLHDGDKPDNDIVTEGPIVEIDGVWTQTYTGRDLTAEEKRQSMKVTMRQARLALLTINKLSLVHDAIALMPEPDKSQIEVEWEYASTVERTSPWVATMGAALGLTDDELDQLFESARTL